MKLKLWQILEKIDTEEIQDGNKFQGINLPITLIIEYDAKNHSLIYNNLMGNVTSRETVNCCNGELTTMFEKID